MRRRLAAALLLGAALGLHVGVTLPARQQQDEARAGFARGREERERLRAQAARLERRAPVAPAPMGDAAAARALRISFLRATEALDLEAIRMAVTPERSGPVAARGHLMAEGRQADLLRVAGRLAEPASGVQLERLSLTALREAGVELRVEAYTMRVGADTPRPGAGR